MAAGYENIKQEIEDIMKGVSINLKTALVDKHKCPSFQQRISQLLAQQRRLKIRLVSNRESARAGTKFVSLRSLYTSLLSGIARADLFRYAYIYAHGGVYLDTKSGVYNDVPEKGQKGQKLSLDDAVFGIRQGRERERPRKRSRILLPKWG